VPEKALEEWAVASEKDDYNREEFCEAFRRKYEGVRSEDIDFFVRTFKVSLMTDPMNRTLEKEKEKEQATAPMNPILLEGKEKDKASAAPSSTPRTRTKKRKGSDEEPRPKKQTKKGKKGKQARRAEPAPEPEQNDLEPPPDSEGEEEKVVKPWYQVKSMLGGIVWEKTVEYTTKDGKKKEMQKYCHKDESIKHLPNYHGSSKWGKYNKNGTTHGGQR
jgi:hypothetical protein